MAKTVTSKKSKPKPKGKSSVSVTSQAAKRKEPEHLFDIAPKNAEKILPIARKYRDVVSERVELTASETALKEQLLDEIKKANLPYVDGKIRFTLDGVEITVTPRDELIRVKEKGESAGKDESNKD